MKMKKIHFWCDGWDVRCPGGLGARGDRARTCAVAWHQNVFDVGRAGCAGGVFSKVRSICIALSSTRRQRLF